MNRKLKYSRFFVFLVVLLGSVLANAVYLDDVQFKAGDRVGFFIGTFDPPHAGHDEVMRQALAAGLDYVVIISNDLSVHKQSAADSAIRNHLLEKAYLRDPKILVPRMEESPLPTVLRALRYLKSFERKNNIHLYKFGLMGSDVAEKLSRRLLWQLIPIASSPSLLLEGFSFWNGFFVSTRQGAPAIPEKIDGKPVTVLVPSKSYSSTQLREWFRKHLGALAVATDRSYASQRESVATLIDPDVFDAYVQYLLVEENKKSDLNAAKACSKLVTVPAPN